MESWKEDIWKRRQPTSVYELTQIPNPPLRCMDLMKHNKSLETKLILKPSLPEGEKELVV